MNPTLIRTSLLGMLLMAALSGCSTMGHEKQMTSRIADDAFDRQEAISNPVEPRRSFVVKDGFYAARKPLVTVPVNDHAQLPPVFSKDASMNDQGAITLSEIASRITARLGYVVAIDQDLIDEGNSTQAGAAPAAVPVATEAAAGLPPLPGTEADPAGAGLPFTGPALVPASSTAALTLPNFIFSGNLTGLLDTLTGKLNLSWRWTGDRIEIFRHEVRMFRLDALAGNLTNNGNINTNSSAGGSSGGSGGASSGVTSTGTSGQTTSFTNDMSVWKDVEAAIKGVLSKGGSLTMSSSAGLVTVRDTPAILRQVESMMGEFNRLYGRQVTLQVEVYAVEKTANQEAGVDWNLVYNKASEFGATVNALGALGGNSAGGGQTFSLSQASGRWSGSSVLFQALSGQGRTSLLNSSTVTTMNGQTAPVNIAREQAYVQSSSTTLGNSTTGGQTTTLTPGLVTDGIAMNFTPRILENNDVLLRYAIDMSTIEDITNFVTPDGTSAIQLPRRAVRNFLQNVTLHSGDALVLTGFQQLQGTQSGVGSLLGGSRKASTVARTVVIVVTPYVIER